MINLYDRNSLLLRGPGNILNDSRHLFRSFYGFQHDIGGFAGDSAAFLYGKNRIFYQHWRETGKVFDTVLFRVLPGMDDKRTLL